MSSSSGGQDGLYTKIRAEGIKRKQYRKSDKKKTSNGRGHPARKDAVSGGWRIEMKRNRLFGAADVKREDPFSLQI